MKRAAVAVAFAAVIAACGGGARAPNPAPSAPPPLTPAAPAEVRVADAPVVGVAARGEAIYGRCLACHSLDTDRTGPHHCGVVGRRAASVEGFTYSDAMKRSGIVWDERSLDRFLTAPGTVVPGTAMTWAGIPDAQERADLIAWLKEQGTGPSCR